MESMIPPIAGVQTKTTQSGRVVVRRDPITGQMLKDEPAAEGTGERPKQQYKRYVAPQKPPSPGQKASGFFKNLFEKYFKPSKK